ncbi:MAG: peptide ABC transporter ATP-binding protein [Actinobacteria bacterium 13_1_20CM_3_71_11]|nr:MAG: peptide ABC transporter ATP-binding protein [Actinobacteria bacterium 13_1_20CM_3_71_11]
MTDQYRPPVSRAVNATKIYGTGEAVVRALDDVTVEFAGGSFTAITGPSGSGKSTLMHCLAGLDTPTSGHVYLGDTDLGTLSDTKLTLLRRRRIGFVFQAYNLVPTLTAAENVMLPLMLAGSRGDRSWLDAVVGAVGLGDRLRHRPAQLSGGQQQRVAVARFLRRAVDELGQTIVMVTHDPVAAGYADAVLTLVDGRVAQPAPVGR